MIFTLDARTAAPHFPGIGRYVRSLAEAMLGQLAESETLQLLGDPFAPDRLLRSAAPCGPATSPFGLNQQWRIPPL
jgi:hypothetical protein